MPQRSTALDISLARFPLRTIVGWLKCPYPNPKRKSTAAEDLMRRVSELEDFRRKVKGKYPWLPVFKSCNSIHAYNKFAASTVTTLCAGCPWRKDALLKMIQDDTGKRWLDLEEMEIHEVFCAPKEHVDIDSFDDNVVSALAEYATDEATRRAAAAKAVKAEAADEAVRAEADESKLAKKPRVVKRKRGAATEEHLAHEQGGSREAKKRPAPRPSFGHTKSLTQLIETMRDSTGSDADLEEAAAARAEIRRREMLCLSVLCILYGWYDGISRTRKKNRDCCYFKFSSTAEDVRSESMLDIAEFAFSDEDGAVICGALAEVLRDLLSVPDTFTLEQIKTSPLREVCGLSTKHAPVLVFKREYYEQLHKKPANVDAIIGSALKERLRLIDPEWVAEPDSEP